MYSCMWLGSRVITKRERCDVKFNLQCRFCTMKIPQDGTLNLNTEHPDIFLTNPDKVLPYTEQIMWSIQTDIDNGCTQIILAAVTASKCSLVPNPVEIRHFNLKFKTSPLKLTKPTATFSILCSETLIKSYRYKHSPGFMRTFLQASNSNSYNKGGQGWPQGIGWCKFK